MSLVVPHFTPAKRAGDFIFVSGQLAFVEPGVLVEGGLAAQLDQCMQNIESALAEVGASLQDVVKNMVWLTSPVHFPEFNSAYAGFFPEAPPARATVCSALMVPGALIEIEATAYKPL